MASAVDMMNVDSAPSAAQRRRERRLRQFLRHERLTVAMVLSERKRCASSGQRTDRTGRWVGEALHGRVPPVPGTRYYDLDDDDSVPELGGSQPDRLIPASGPQERIQRHTVEQIIETSLPVPVLDDLVPLWWTI